MFTLIEPDNRYKFTIPQEIWDSEHIMILTSWKNIPCEKYGKNNRKNRKKISDHPMIILKMEIPIPMKEKYQTISILDKNIIK